MKKIIVLTLAMIMALSLASCGKKDAPKPPASSVAASQAPASSAPASQAPASSAPASQAPASSAPASSAPASSVAASQAPASQASADSEELVYTLDYSVIAEWVDSGFIGTDDSGAPVVMAIDAENETAIIIFGDNSDMTAASFLGPITYTDTTGTITDETNESTLTFGVKQVAEDTIELDMGDIGKATIKAETREKVLETIKNAIDNYKHIA